jgi:glycosyltransferase involved in cell wall biosynthesis
MRVAFDVGPVRAEPTGIGVAAASLARALAARMGPQDLVLIGRRPGADGLPDGVPTTPLTRGGYLGWLQTRAPRDVRRTGATVEHFTDGMVPFVRSGRTVVTVHDLSVVRSWRTHPARRMSRVPFALLAPRLADLVIVPSRATADDVIRLTRTQARKIEVVPMAPQRQMTAPSEETLETTLRRYGLERHGYILALGAVEPRKNHARLVGAFERLVDSRAIPATVELVVAGPPAWHARRILERMDRSPQAARIRRLGYVPADDLPALLSGAAVVAYPSLFEGFGLPVVEAMACGAPTVTSDRSSMPEVAGDAAFLVDPYDVDAIARGIETALRAGQMDRPGVAARAMAQASLFTWDRTAAATLELYGTRLP